MKYASMKTVDCLPAGQRAGAPSDRAGARACALTGLMCLLLGSGCSIPIPQAERDPTKYYVLSTAAGAAAPQANAPVVQLRAIDVANYLSGRPMVVRRSENEIDFREFARWGESLELGIGRVLREELERRGAARVVTSAAARRDAAGGQSTLSIRVLACEGLANGEVAFRAGWELTSAGANGLPPKSGEFRAQGLRWDGKHEGSLAAALSQAVAALAGEIAAALK